MHEAFPPLGEHYDAPNEEGELFLTASAEKGNDPVSIAMLELTETAEGLRYVPSPDEAIEAALDKWQIPVGERPEVVRRVFQSSIRQALRMRPADVDLDRAVEVLYLGSVTLGEVLAQSE